MTTFECYIIAALLIYVAFQGDDLNIATINSLMLYAMAFIMFGTFNLFVSAAYSLGALVGSL